VKALFEHFVRQARSYAYMRVSNDAPARRRLVVGSSTPFCVVKFNSARARRPLPMAVVSR